MSAASAGFGGAGFPRSFDFALPRYSKQRPRHQDPVESSDEELIQSSQEGQEEADRIEGRVQVVLEVFGVARPIARGVMVVEGPGKNRQERKRQREPSCRTPFPTHSPGVGPGNGQQDDSRFLTQDGQRCGKGKARKVAAWQAISRPKFGVGKQGQNRERHEQGWPRLDVQHRALREEKGRRGEQ